MTTDHEDARGQIVDKHASCNDWDEYHRIPDIPDMECRYVNRFCE